MQSGVKSDEGSETCGSEGRKQEVRCEKIPVERVTWVLGGSETPARHQDLRVFWIHLLFRLWEISRVQTNSNFTNWPSNVKSMSRETIVSIHELNNANGIESIWREPSDHLEHSSLQKGANIRRLRPFTICDPSSLLAAAGCKLSARRPLVIPSWNCAEKLFPNPQTTSVKENVSTEAETAATSAKNYLLTESESSSHCSLSQNVFGTVDWH